tara:strand:- start:1310 stop:1762 length:453 start_codon:yes stop_codon:yes gene_type:complete
MINNQDKRNGNPQKLPSGQKSWKWKGLNVIEIAFHCLMAIWHIAYIPGLLIPFFTHQYIPGIANRPGYHELLFYPAIALGIMLSIISYGVLVYKLIEIHKVRSSNKSICDRQLNTPDSDLNRRVQSQDLDDKNRMINSHDAQGTHTRSIS